MLDNLLYQKITGNISGSVKTERRIWGDVQTYELECDNGQAIWLGHELPAPELEPGDRIVAYIPRITCFLNSAFCYYDDDGKMKNAPQLKKFDLLGKVPLAQLRRFRDTLAKIVLQESDSRIIN